MSAHTKDLLEALEAIVRDIRRTPNTRRAEEDALVRVYLIASRAVARAKEEA